MYTADTIAEQFGVVKASYESVPLPPRTVLTAVCKGPGKPQEQVEVVELTLPPELEWGEVGWHSGHHGFMCIACPYHMSK